MGRFPLQSTCSEERVSMSWCRHENFFGDYCYKEATVCRWLPTFSRFIYTSWLLRKAWQTHHIPQNMHTAVLQLVLLWLHFAWAWWRHQMETISALLALCAGNSQVNGEFPSQRPVTRGFAGFFDLCLNKQLSNQTWGWGFETLSRSLWRHCNGL